MMSHTPPKTPPLPYTGAITIRNILDNPLVNYPPPVFQDDKNKLDDDDDAQFTMFHQSALLGSSLWDPNSIIPCNDINDFKVELLDNDDFWSELNALSNQIADVEGRNTPVTMSPKDLVLPAPESPLVVPPTSPDSGVAKSPNLASALLTPPGGRSPTSSGPNSPQPPKEHFMDKYTPEALVLASIPGEGLYNPGKRKFNVDELKPQPVVKKSKKTFVPELMKDDRYWARRRKNNTAAKRSRDAKRIKENQIALRAGFLEEENDFYRTELIKVRAENKSLLERLARYESP